MSIITKLRELADYDKKIEEKKRLYEDFTAKATEKINLCNQFTVKSKELEANYNAIYQSIYNKAQADALANVQNALDQKNKELVECIGLIGTKKEEYEKQSKDLTTLNKDWESLSKKVVKLKSVYKSVLNAVNKYFKQEFIEETAIKLPEQGLDALAEDDYSPTVKLTFQCMNVKQLRQRFNQNDRLIKDTLKRYEDRYTTKANAAIYKLIVIALESELQNVLFNISFGKEEKAVNDITKMTAKYLKIATDGNQHIAPTLVRFIGEIESLFIEAVKIEYEYHVQKERIKEEQRALREQMRQEAEERRILEQQRKQIEKEEGKYKTEMAAISEQISKTEDQSKIDQLNQRLTQLEEQLHSVEEKKDEIVNLQNGKAGYVYIISNLGSFGDTVFKIGMTRRLEPQERVNELGDASVPFPFDVHSFIFSDDAVSLETNMHKSLNDQRMNKVNLRKEFFKVSLDDLENLVYALEPTCEFNRTMLAEQYNQSLSITNVVEFSETNEANDENEVIQTDDEDDEAV